MVDIDMLKSLMDARYDKEFLEALLAIWPDPKTGKPPLSQASLAREAGLSQSAISKYLGGRDPQLEELRKLEIFFKIIELKPDGNRRVDNEKTLNDVKAFLETHVYKKA